MSDKFERISIGPEARDEFWLLHGGAIELRFRAPMVTKILLDLVSLNWADPVPLLAIACLCAEFRDRGGKLTIDLGRPRDSNQEFRIFFAQHGFLAAMAKDTTVLWAGRTYSPPGHQGLEAELRSLAGALAYQDAECIPARLIGTRELTPNYLDQLVENLVDIAHPRISGWLPQNSRRRGLMTHQVRVFLSEALDNIQEHAYRNGAGYGAIYARIRAGAPPDPQGRRAWTTAKSKEASNCPTLNRCRVGRPPGWLELFVCDVGVGITHDFAGADAAAPLQVMSGLMFRAPLSRIADRTQAGKTNMTGLQRIGQLLRARRDDHDRGDFARIYSGGEWVGEHVPWPEAGVPGLPGLRNVRRVEDASYPSGTVLHFALEPPPETAAEQASLYPDGFYQPQWEDLAHVREELMRAAGVKIRVEAFFDVYRAENQRFAEALFALKHSSAFASPVVVVRPSRVQRKSSLFDQVTLALGEGSSARNLIFADVPWSSAIDFYNIISTQSSWRNAAPNTQLRVHILSQDWFCASLIFDPVKRIFEPSLEVAVRFVSGSANSVSAAYIAAVLRRQDSILFWNEARLAYLNEPILWQNNGDGKGKTIWGYVDLNLALAMPSTHEIARRALRRAVSSFRVGAVDAADDAIARVLGTDFELAQLHPHSAKEKVNPAVLVGSVLCDGDTLKRLRHGVSVAYHGAVQLLRHPDFARDSNADHLTALEWLPPKRPEGHSRKAIFERVANTPFVIRGGESAVPLARFRKPSKGEERVSLYAETPNESYQHWQRLGLLRLGHWTYGSNHDLLTLRLGDALVYDAVEGKKMVNWLATQIREWIPYEEGRVTGFVVYAQHSVTSALARALKPMLNDVPFFPAAPASSQGKAALLLSPMTREAVIELCGKDLRNGGAAVILDDAIISGVTVRGIRHALEGLWETLRDIGRVEPTASLQVNSLAIVDRSNEPAQRALVERDLAHDRRYWRWDVPSLGNAGACSLCGLHGRWKALGSAIHGNFLRQRLDYWLDKWEAIPVEEGRFDAGIQARRLEVQSATRFGIERGQKAHEVTHSVSVSRVSIAAEIARATTRKDYPLNKGREALAGSRHIDTQTGLEVVASQLLLFQGELTPADRIDRLELLLELLWDCPEATITTALAAMTTLLDQSLVDEVWKYAIDLISDRGFPNEDTILVALALNYMAKINPPSLGDGTPWEVFDLCRRSPTEDRQALAMILRVFGWSPNSVHRTTLPDHLANKELVDSSLAQTILMLERLADAFRGMPLAALEGSVLDPRADGNALSALARSIASAREKVRIAPTDEAEPAIALRALLDEAWTMLFDERGLHVRYRRQLCVTLSGQSAARNVLAPAWRLLSERWDAFVSSKGLEVAEQWEALPTVWFEPSDGARKKVDLYYDGSVCSAIAELMSNVIHRSIPITCPWPNGPELPPKDLWARVNVANDGASATIELVNGYQGNGDVRPHMSPNLIHIEGLGGKIDTHIDKGRALIFTRIKLPTAAGLAGS